MDICKEKNLKKKLNDKILKFNLRDNLKIHKQNIQDLMEEQPLKT